MQLVLMDIKLPFYNGYHWCSEIRKSSKVPIIFLSSAADNMNIVMAVNFQIEQYADMALQYTRLGTESNDFVFEWTCGPVFNRDWTLSVQGDTG